MRTFEVQIGCQAIKVVAVRANDEKEAADIALERATNPARFADGKTHLTSAWTAQEASIRVDLVDEIKGW